MVDMDVVDMDVVDMDVVDMDVVDMDMVDMDMVDQRNVTQRNLSHSWIRWTTGHGHSGPRKQSIALSIIESDMPSALGLVYVCV